MTSTVQRAAARGVPRWPTSSTRSTPAARSPARRSAAPWKSSDELEPAPRGIYTGAIGWFDPPADGAPRSATSACRCRSARWRCSAGARTACAAANWASAPASCTTATRRRICRMPAQGALPDRPANDFEIFETMHATREDGCRHLRRAPGALRRIGAYFGAPSGAARAAAIDAACAMLAAGAPPAPGAEPDGALVVHTAPLAPLAEPVRVLLASGADAFRRPVPAPQDQHPQPLRRRLARGRSARRVRHPVLQRARRADRGRPQQRVRARRRPLVHAAAVLRRAAGRDARR
jgi:hypothetical protein